MHGHPPDEAESDPRPDPRDGPGAARPFQRGPGSPDQPRCCRGDGKEGAGHRAVRRGCGAWSRVLTPERTASLLAEWSRLESPGGSSTDVATTPLNEPPAPGSDQFECEVIAGNLVRGAGYCGISWGQPQEHLTAYRPPVTPVTWALFFAAFGHRFDVIRLADILYGTISLWLLFLIGRRMFSGRVGLMAAAVLAVWPSAVFLTGSLLTETLYVMLELLFVWLCLRAGDRPTLTRFVLAGLCAGLATLTRPNLLLALPLLPLWSAVVFRRDWRAMVKSLAVPAAAVAAISPWTVRNYQVFHKFVPVSTLGGINLLQGNNDHSLAHPDLTGNFMEDKIPGFQERARGLNEAERDEVALQMARTWLMDHRDRWGYLAWIKLKQFCTPFLHQPSRLALDHAAELGTCAPTGGAGPGRDVLGLRPEQGRRVDRPHAHPVRSRRLRHDLRDPALSVPD